MRIRLFLLLVLVATLIPGANLAATPAAGTVSPLSPKVSWTGGPFVTSNPSTLITSDPRTLCLAVDPACDRFALTIVPATGNFTVDIAITTASTSDDFDLYVFAADGRRVASSTSEGGNERVTLANPAAGTYTVGVLAWLVEPGATYSGTATLTSGATVTPSPDSVEWNYNPEAP